MDDINLLLLDKFKYQNTDLMDQSNKDEMTQTQQINTLTRSKSLDINDYKKININQALTAVVQQSRPEVGLQTANFAQQQAQNEQINVGPIQDPILAYRKEWEDLKTFSLYDSGKFNDVGNALFRYKELSEKGQFNDVEKLACIKIIRDKVQKYLYNRETKDGSQKRSESGRRRLIFMRDLLETLTQREFLLECSKWENNGGGKSESIISDATKELKKVDDEYKKIGAERHKLISAVNKKDGMHFDEIPDGKFKFLSNKMAYLEYQKKMLTQLSKDGKIKPDELRSLAAKYYERRYALYTLQPDLVRKNSKSNTQNQGKNKTGTKKTEEKIEVTISPEYIYDREKKINSSRYVKNAYYYLKKENFKKSYDENFDLEVMNVAKTALKTANINVQTQNGHVPASVLTDFLQTTQLQVRPLNATNEGTQTDEINTQATENTSKPFETVDNISIKKFNFIENSVIQRNEIVEQVRLLSQIANNNGASKECKNLLNHAIENMDKLSEVAKTDKSMSKYRQSDMDYNEAMWDLKDAYLWSQGELKEAIAVFLYSIKQSTRGNLDVKGKKIQTCHDWTFTDATKEGIVMKFERSFAPLFAHEPIASDISQGCLGDCFLLAEMTTIVRTNPKIIKDAMVDEGNTVAVRFFNDEGGEDIIRIDKTVIRTQDNNKKHFDHDFFATGQLWVQMLEKAYVAYKYQKKYSLVSGSAEVNNLTQLLVKDADYSDNFLNADQDQSIEQRLFIYEKNFNNFYYTDRANEFEGSFDEFKAKGETEERNEYRRKKHGYAIELCRAAYDRLSKNGKLTKSDLFEISQFANTKQINWPKDKKEQETRQVENHAYQAMVNIIDNNLKEKNMDFSETDIATLNKQFELARNELIGEIKDKKGTFYKVHFNSKIGSEWLVKRVEKAYMLVDAFIAATIKAQIRHDATGTACWDDYSDKENKDFESIQKAVLDKKFIMLDSHGKGFLKHVDANKMKSGIYARHAYCILDTQEKMTDYGYMKKMVLIKNPHGYATAQYQDDKKQGMIRSSNREQTNAGLFWLDIRDLESCFTKFHISSIKSKSKGKTA